MVNKAIEETKRKTFNDIMLELSSSPEILQSSEKREEFYLRFEKLYSSEGDSDFHHFYSDIFIVLTKVNMDSSLGAIDYLGANMRYIRENYVSKNPDPKNTGKNIDISSNLRKLYDHISLDIARIHYSQKGDRDVSGESNIAKLNQAVIQLEEKTKSAEDKMSDISLQTEKLNSDFNKFNEKAVEFQKELDSTKKSYIEILGIFSGIVLAFMGGMIFSSSVLENIHQSSIYRLIIITLIILALTLNSLFICFKSIEHIVNKRKTKNIAWIVTNIIIILAIAFIMLLWNNGYVENRNYSVLEKSTSQTK